MLMQISDKKRKSILSSLGDFRSLIGFYARDFASGSCLEHRADVRFFPVEFSDMALLVEVFEQVEKGRLLLSDRHILPPDTVGPGPLESLRDRPAFTLLDYCRLMIIFGDGDATRLIKDLLYKSSLAEGREATDTTHRYLESYTTPRILGALFERLALGRLISRQASSRMIEILKQASTALPPFFASRLSSDFDLAYRSIENSRVRADVGIFFLPHGETVISVFSENQSLGGPPAELIANCIGQIVEWARLLHE